MSVKLFTTKDEIISGHRCQYIERTEHGGWTRCNRLATGAHYIHGDDPQGFYFCHEHARYSGIAMRWTEFLQQAWVKDPYARFWIQP